MSAGSYLDHLYVDCGLSDEGMLGVIFFLLLLVGGIGFWCSRQVRIDVLIAPLFCLSSSRVIPCALFAPGCGLAGVPVGMVLRGLHDASTDLGAETCLREEDVRGLSLIHI